MAKGKKSKKAKKSTPIQKSEKKIFENIKPWQQILIASVIILVATFFILSDLSFKRMEPIGGDVLSSKGKVNLMKQYEEQTGENSLWNPAIFAGMPQYHRYGPQSWSLDTLAGYFFNDNGGQVLVYYMIGAIGMFILLYSIKFSFLISLFGALAFLLMPHYNSLWLAGHFSKFRAIMLIPWVVAAFFYFLEKKNLFSILLFTLAFSLQVRTQHYQIIFYTALILFAIGVYPVIKLIIDKKLIEFSKVVGLFVIGVILTILSVYQPLFVMSEYTPYSTRGGNPVKIEKTDDSAEQAKGVSFEYATNWSLSPKEMICFLIPRYFGGTSQEKYTGDAVPQLKGRTIPGYWGDMPFTGSTDYIGVALFVLMVIGIYGYWRDWRIKSLVIFMIFALLLGFGRHFAAFYKIFFYNLPYFSKFRVPTMIMMAVFVVFTILAAFGLKYLVQSYKDQNKKIFTILYIIAGFLFLLSISPFILKETLSFSTPQEISQYDPQVLTVIKEARYDLMKMDALRTLLFSILIVGTIFIFLKKYIPSIPFLILIIGIMLVDVIFVNNRFFDALVDEQTLKSRYFLKTQLDDYLLAQNENDPEPFRVLGLGRNFSDNDLAYYHQCIGGYDAAKMQTIQDIIDNNLYRGWDRRFPINWNVVNFLNGKYLVSDQELSHENLNFTLKDNQKNVFLYENKAVLPRSFLVGKYQKFDDRVELVRTLNARDFDPSKIALLEKELPAPIEQPDSLSHSKVISFTPNKIKLEARSNQPCLLVLSETYYPKGWRAYVDGKETEIYKTNHILRSIVLPVGTHQIEFVFHPETYYRGKLIATIANIVVLVSIVGLFSLRFLQKNRKTMF